MAIGAYTMAILVAKEGVEHVARHSARNRSRRPRGRSRGLPTLRPPRGDYFAIVTIAFSQIALGRDSTRTG